MPAYRYQYTENRAAVENFAQTLSPDIFASRRRKLMNSMGSNSVAVLSAATEMPRNRDVHYPFRQDSNFYYLTGFPEPGAVAVLLPGADQEFLLFCRDRDPIMEIWNGHRAGLQGAMERYGADCAYSIEKINQLLPPLFENREQVFYAMGYNPDFDSKIMGWLNHVRSKGRAGVHAPTTFIAIEKLLNPLRLIKDSEEIAIMRESARIAVDAHCQAMRVCQPGMMEYEIEAEILYTFQHYGVGWSYPAIVAGGDNSCILHYTENNARLRDGEVLLIDAGAEMDGYASDITRTFPVNGHFSAEQRAVYDIVLAAQKAAIDKVRPGCSFNEPHEAAVRVITEGLVDLGLLYGDVDELIETEQYKPFYMHHTGHWLGMDVHDVGAYKTGNDWQVFEPGMVTTVEPGLYFSADSVCIDPQWLNLGIHLAHTIDPRWWRIGVRIEDDVLVTAEGHEVLTDGAPKEIDAIEALMRDSR